MIRADMDMAAVKSAISDITDLSALIVIFEAIQREARVQVDTDWYLDDSDNTPEWDTMTEIGALIACRIETVEEAWYMTNPHLPTHTRSYADTKTMALHYVLYGTNDVYGGIRYIEDTDDEMGISDMLPTVAVNPMYADN